MQWITVGAPPFRIEQYDQVFAQLDEQPDGLETRYVGTDDDGKVRIVAVWESKEHADRFFAETRGPLLAQALGSEPVGRPDVMGIEVAHRYVREPVA
jgi:hypothetical protein